MAVYTYVSNKDPSERTAVITLRNGSLVIPMGSHASITVEELALLIGRYNMVEGEVAGSPPASSVAAHYGLDDLVDVDTLTTPPEDGSALQWVASSKLWKPGTSGGSSTPLSGFIDAIARFLVPATTNTIDFKALKKAMEEENKGALLPPAWVSKEPILMNVESVPSELKSSFKYVFWSPTLSIGQLPAVNVANTIMFRVNQTVEGTPFDEVIHGVRCIFWNIGFTGSGVSDGGSVYSSYNCSVRVEECKTSKLKDVFIETGFSDSTGINGLSGDSSVTGTLYQSESGDGKVLLRLKGYGKCKLVKIQQGSGVGVGWVSGTAEFKEAGFTLIEPHLEGDGPDVAEGKPSAPLLEFKGGDYEVVGGKLFALTNPSRPIFLVKDSPGAHTSLKFNGTRFMQRLDDPSNPSGKKQPVGNLQGITGKFVGLAHKSTIVFYDCHSETYQQTSTSSASRKSEVGLKFSVESTEGLEEELVKRRVMLASTNCQIRYNSSSAKWEVRPAGSASDSVTTHRLEAPALVLTELASGSEEAKAAPTTLAEGNHYYVAHSIDDHSRNTNLGAEQLLALAKGTPLIEVKAGQPCRVILWRGTAPGVFTEWVEIILPQGLATLADMGNAIGGQEWSSSNLPTKPTTAAAENNTAAGRVLFDASGGAVEIYGSARPTTGEWQKAGCLYTSSTGLREVCVTAATGNNGGVWNVVGGNAFVGTQAEVEPQIAALPVGTRWSWDVQSSGGTAIIDIRVGIR